MSMESQPSFRLVRRGYEPSEVDQRITDLMKQAGSQQQRVVELTTRVRELEASRSFADAEQPASGPPTFGDLGTRVGQILSLADEEAAAMRAGAKSDIEARLLEAEQAAEKVRLEADDYARQRRDAADEEAKTLIGNAHRRADELHEETKRDAEARRAEADAVYEAQQAKAAQAAADFETTLADRRDKVEKEFAAQFETTRSQIDAAQAHLEQTRNEAERIRNDAELGARRHLEDAQKEAAEIVAAARAHADRIRAESDRALVAATQRRDSINAQLANVRQMLATLTNVSPAGLLAMEEPPLAELSDLPDVEDQPIVEADADVEAEETDQPGEAESRLAEAENEAAPVESELPTAP